MDQDSLGDSGGHAGSSSKSINQSNGISTDKLDISVSSTNADSTVRKAKKAPAEISIDDFLQINSAKIQSNAALSATIEGLSNNLAFRIKPLSDVPADQAQFLIAECFTKKGDLEKSAHMAPEDFLPVVRNAWSKLLRYSFVLVDEKDDIVAVATIADAVDMADHSCEGSHQYVHEIFNYLDALMDKVSGQLPPATQPGVMLVKYLLGASLKNSRAENIYLFYLMEIEIHKRAHDHQFRLSVAQNTSPLTQQLSAFFGCKRLLTDKPTGYVNPKGDRPFANVPSYKEVTIDVKEY